MECLLAEGTIVGIAVKPDLSDAHYGPLWMDKVFTPSEPVRTFYAQDGVLRWVMRLNNLFVIAVDRQVEWLAG